MGAEAAKLCCFCCCLFGIISSIVWLATGIGLKGHIYQAAGITTVVGPETVTIVSCDFLTSVYDDCNRFVKGTYSKEWDGDLFENANLLYEGNIEKGYPAFRKNNGSGRIVVNKDENWVYRNTEGKEIILAGKSLTPLEWETPEWEVTETSDGADLKLVCKPELIEILYPQIYAGSYKLQKSLFNGHRNWKGQTSEIYFSDEGVWVFGDSSHTVGLPVTQETSSCPQYWPEWRVQVQDYNKKTFNMSFTDDTLIPPNVTFTDARKSNHTIIMGSYVMMNTTHRSLPQYQKTDNPSPRIYVNSKGFLIIGDTNYSNNGFKMSREAMRSYSKPFDNLAEWTKAGQGNTYMLNDYNLLPPAEIKLLSTDYHGYEKFLGSYSLMLPFHGEYPQYKRNNAEYHHLYVNSKRYWTIGDNTNPECGIRVSHQPMKRDTYPPVWPEWNSTDNTECLTDTTYCLSDHTLLPPLHLQLNMNSTINTTLGDKNIVKSRTDQLIGSYDLIITDKDHCDFPSYKKENSSTLLHANGNGVWKIPNDNGVTLSFTTPTPYTPLLWKEWSNKEITSGNFKLTLVTNTVLEDYIETDTGYSCITKNGNQLYLKRTKEDLQWCNGLRDCRNQMDEMFCPFWASSGKLLPLGITGGLVVIGLIAFGCLTCLRLFSDKNTVSEEEEAFLNDDTMKIINKIYQHYMLKKEAGESQSPIQESESVLPDALDTEFLTLHNSKRGISELIQACFILLETPDQKHSLARFIKKEETKIHKNNYTEFLLCIREKCGSNKAVECFLDHIENPSCLKNVTYTVSSFFTSMKKKMGRFKILIKPFLSISKVFFFTYDFIKDILIWNYLLSKLKYINENLFYKLLVYFNGATIVTAQLLMGTYVILKFDTMFITPKTKMNKNILYVILFICTPFLPCIIMWKMVSEAYMKDQLKDKLQKETNIYENISSPTQGECSSPTQGECSSPTQGGWKKYKELHNNMREMHFIYASMRLIESSIESLPQLVILIIYLIVDQTSGIPKIMVDIGYDNSFYSLIFLVGNIIYSFTTIISAILGSINMMKREQIGLKGKVILGLSYSLQIISRILPIVSISIIVLKETVLLVSYLYIVIAIVIVPFIFHFTCLPIIYAFFLKSPVWRDENMSVFEKFLHIIVNIWVTIPLRRFNNETMWSKAKEYSCLLTIAGVDIMWMLFFLVMAKGKAPVTSSIGGQLADITFIITPAAFILSCVLLVIFYKFGHTWHQLQVQPCCCNKRDTTCCIELRCYKAEQDEEQQSEMNNMNNRD